MPASESASRGRLPPSRYPRLARLFEEAERVFRTRTDVQRRIPDLASWEFWFWFSWHGPAEHEELRPLFYPQPPAYLMHRVVGEGTTDASFLLSGLWDWRRIYLSLVEGGFDFARGGRILDFGCGCGRILRHFARYSPTCDFSGTDVDEVAVGWCRENLDFATFEVLPKTPPTTCPATSFDAVFAFSVFSHLPEALHRAWLEHLFRATKPGALLVVTLQGTRVIERMIARNLAHDVPTADVLRRDQARIQETGFAFYPYRQHRYDDRENQEFFDGWDFAQYGSTFILDRYFRAHWSDLFHVVSWSPAPDDWQDYVILRRLPEREPLGA